jgi:preprotein translocase subunit YajC
VLFHAAVLAASTAATAKKSSGSPIGTFVLFGVLIAVAYLVFVRPAKARQRRALETRQDILPGVEVVTTAQLLATVVSVDDDVVTLEIAPGVHGRFLRGAIARVVTDDEPEPEFADSDPQAGSTSGGTAETATPEDTPPEPQQA